MPSNGQFGFSILVGGQALPEYQHPEDNTRMLVESILWSPVTYWLSVKEYCRASEEMETQKWPVTPYEIKVRLLTVFPEVRFDDILLPYILGLCGANLLDHISLQSVCRWHSSRYALVERWRKRVCVKCEYFG